MSDSKFELNSADKSSALLEELKELTDFHSTHSNEYRRIISALFAPTKSAASIEDLPWLPVRLFKELNLKSILDQDVFRILTSSGTTGQQVSRIYLDKQAASSQAAAMTGTFSQVLGEHRLPMLIVDSKKVASPGSLSARGAGVLGMMNMGRKHVFALDDNEELDIAKLSEFLNSYGSQPFFIFGFTFMIWSNLIMKDLDYQIDLSKGILVHGGGWKKLSDLEIGNEEFRNLLFEKTGLARIHNFYGMVEQIGTIHLESPAGDGLYTPDFAEIVIRDSISLKPLPVGEPGLIQVVSTLPRSYPGHSLLTEDLGVVLGIDDGYWPGKRFAVLGRLPKAEVRGCSDTFTTNGR
jgi:hypothetical protein